MTDKTNPASNSKKQNTDAVPAGTPFSGENLCRKCNGTGRAEGGPCPECGGSGKVLTPVGGAG